MFHRSRKRELSKSAAYFSLLVLLALPISIFAQNPANELWRVRAEGITEDLINDGQQLPPLRRAVLRARLAERWWRDDQRRAAGRLQSAVEIVEQVPNKETVNERRERLETAGVLLKIAIRLDRKLAQRLVAVLSSEENLKGIEGNGNADALINAAASLVDLDARRAAELGALALRIGPPSDVAALLFPLYRRNVLVANGFLAQAMAAAREDQSGVLLNSLTYVVFPKQKGWGDPLPIPDHTPKELLQLDIAFLNRGSNCAAVVGFITPVLSEFERLLPQQAAVARQAVNQCQPLIPVDAQKLVDHSNRENRIEELLKAAADAKEPIYRAALQYEAANLARSNKDYELALKILDGMSKESRECMGGAWETYRWDWAAEAAVEHYMNERLLEMNRTLDGVPAEWQAFAKTAFLDRLTDRKLIKTGPALPFLNDARAALGRSSLPDTDKYGCYFVLLRLTVKHDPAAASAALKEAIASLNRAEQAMNKDQKTLNSSGFLQVLPASLLEMDEFAVKEGLASITSVEMRAQLRLNLLQATLEKIKK